MPVRSILTALSAAPWPRAGGWLVPGSEHGAPGANCTWLEYLIVRRAERDNGILEQPWGSNRGTRIDTMTRRSGAPLGSWWCGIEVGTVFRDCGALVPLDYAAVDAWLPHMVSTPRIGSAIIYGVPGDGRHIGIVARVGIGMPNAPDRAGGLMTCEGNRTFGGTASNNGVAVDLGPMTRRDVLGYVRPRMVPGWRLEKYVPREFLTEHEAALRARPT